MNKVLIVIKPDGVQRGLVGEITARFERAGFRILAQKTVKVDIDFALRHYPGPDEWLKTVGERSLSEYQKAGLDPKKVFKTEDPKEIGKVVRRWLAEFLSSGPVVAMVLTGNNAVENGRRLAGSTVPSLAAPGTIRGDFSLDSASLANAEARPIKNLVHVSGTPEEAEYEIGLWFTPEEILEARV
ncbi:MAG: nucleoside-diphosphate kinase [bacterium]|nr:nucleoside-diphosphate kinase [bacterium]